MIFATSPWSGRVQIPPAKLSREAFHLANYVSSAMTPREKKIVNNKEFQEKCGVGFADAYGDGSTCILVVKGFLFGDAQQNIVQELIKKFSGKTGTAVLTLDSKVRWISSEPTSIWSQKFSMRVYAIRNGTRLRTFNESLSAENVLQFAQTAIKVRRCSYTLLDDL